MNMVEIILSNYLNADNTKDADIAEIYKEPYYAEMDDKFTGGKKNVLNIPCRIDKKELIYSPPKSELKKMIDAWGRDTKQLVSKKFQIVHKSIIDKQGKDVAVVRINILMK
jgi:hypothetical protein